MPYKEGISLLLVPFHLQRLRWHWGGRASTLTWVFEEEESKEECTDQKDHGRDDHAQGSDSTSERSATRSQNTRKLLAVDDREDLSLPYLRADVPLSSTNRDNNHAGEDDYSVETSEKVVQVVRNVTHRQDGQRDEGASDQTDLLRSVRRKSGETGDTEAAEESVAEAEE